jgi:hypothetical protein
MAMLAIPIQPDISRLLQELDLDIERDPSNHITLFYFGDNLPMSKVLKIIPVVFDIVQNLSPFTATVSNYTHFDSDDLYPIICPVKSQALLDLRQKLQKAFGELPLPKGRGFLLSYCYNFS